MIEAQHSIQIDSGIDQVWDYVRDIRQWANLFPGCQECEVIDDHQSRWTIKVGAGGLVKTVTVLVTVEQWDGPERVNFTYKLASEPVVGSGAYVATRKGPDATDISLNLQVVGSGSMAPMWEAMCRPLLPQLAKSFSSKLKVEIEGQPTTPAPGSTGLGGWLGNLWRKIKALFGGR